MKLIALSKQDIKEKYANDNDLLEIIKSEKIYKLPIRKINKKDSAVAEAKFYACIEMGILT